MNTPPWRALFDHVLVLSLPASHERRAHIRRDERFVAYAHAIEEARGEFDFVIGHGMARRLCPSLAIGRPKRGVFLVLDNSNRADFPTCTSFFTRSKERLPTAHFVGNCFARPEC